MPLHITEINRHRFVCGLFWQSLSRRRELRKEALTLGRQLKFDLMVLRIDRGAAMAGFANRADGARAGLSSLGAMVSKTIAVEGAYYDGRQQPAPNWLGAFRLPDGLWAYFAVRDGLFLPNGDVAGTREEVLDRLAADYSLGGWNAVIGDPELEVDGYHNFYPRSIDQLFPHRNGKPRIARWWRLGPTRPTLPQPLLVGAALAGLAVVIAAVWVYIGHQRELEREREAAQRVRLNLWQANAPRPLAHPWAAQPRPVEFVRACLAAFTSVSAGGWALDQYVCTPHAATYTWSRNGSMIAFLLAQQPHAQIDAAGEHATLGVPLNMPAGGDEPLGTDAVRTSLLNLFQTLGRDARIEPVRAVAPSSFAPMAHLGMASAPPRPDWQTWTLDVSLGGVSPRRVAALLEQPGVRVERLAWRGGVWSIQGDLYVR
jgi:hypothetical protein